MFEHNPLQVEQAETFANELGFERFVAKKTDRFVTAKKDKKEEHKAKSKKGKETQLLKNQRKVSNRTKKTRYTVRQIRHYAKLLRRGAQLNVK